MEISPKHEIPMVKSHYIFAMLIGCQGTLLLLSDYLLIEDSLYYDFWASKLSYDRITKLIEESNKWKWVSYISLPVLTMIKCFFISACLFTGAFFAKTDKKFSDFFRVSLIAEFIVLLPFVMKIVWFGFFHRNYGLEEIMYFSPLSLLSLIGRQSIDPWFVYLFRLINFFEILYWLMIAYLLKNLVNSKNFAQRINFVASTYGVGLFIWVLFIMFLTVSIS